MEETEQAERYPPTIATRDGYGALGCSLLPGWWIDRDVTAFDGGDEVPRVVVTPAFDVTQIDIVDDDALRRVGELLGEYSKAVRTLGPVSVPHKARQLTASKT
jgi:hypothetical protein